MQTTMRGDALQLLRSIDSKLGELLSALASPVKREYFAVKEVAELTRVKGVKAYSAFTLRQACNSGRIRARKGDNQSWLIPLAVVEQVLSEGLPRR